MADPLWLPDTLRAEGLMVREHTSHSLGEDRQCPGWRGLGHGDMPDRLWGVVMHHTGDQPPYDAGSYVISHHPTLGLCSQLHLGRDGIFTMCGAGIAWHAGIGNWPGMPNQDANTWCIGIEAENNGSEGWSSVQYNSYMLGVGAILRHLGHDSSRAIGHKEWAGPAQGKWDPGGMDMVKARADIQRVINSKPGEAGGLAEGEDDMSWLTITLENFKKAKLSYKDLLWWMDRNTSLTNDQLMGPDGKGWEILGKSKYAAAKGEDRNNYLVEAVAELRQDMKNLTELVQRAGLTTPVEEDKK